MYFRGSNTVNHSDGATMTSGINNDHREYQPMAHMIAKCLPMRRDSLNHNGMAAIWQTK